MAEPGAGTYGDLGALTPDEVGATVNPAIAAEMSKRIAAQTEYQTGPQAAEADTAQLEVLLQVLRTGTFDNFKRLIEAGYGEKLLTNPGSVEVNGVLLGQLMKEIREKIAYERTGGATAKRTSFFGPTPEEEDAAKGL